MFESKELKSVFGPKGKYQGMANIVQAQSVPDSSEYINSEVTNINN
jgi:hypothetical protein